MWMERSLIGMSAWQGLEKDFSYLCQELEKVQKNSAVIWLMQSPFLLPTPWCGWSTSHLPAFLFSPLRTPEQLPLLPLDYSRGDSYPKRLFSCFLGSDISWWDVLWDEKPQCLFWGEPDRREWWLWYWIQRVLAIKCQQGWAVPYLHKLRACRLKGF